MLSGEENMTRLFSIKPGMTLKGREFRGLRGWAGKPLHPPLTDFPIVCYVLAGCSTSSHIGRLMAGQRSTKGIARDFFVVATYVIIAGAVVSLGTALTGFWDLVERHGQGSFDRHSWQGQTHTGLAHCQLAYDGNAYCNYDRDCRHCYSPFAIQ